MKKIFTILLCFLAIGFFTMCKDDDKTTSPTEENPNSPIPTGTVILSGIVTDVSGSAVTNATITAGTETTLTDTYGAYLIYAAPVVSNRVIITVSKTGYFDAVKSELKSGNTLTISTTLQQKTNNGVDNASTTYDATTIGTISVSGATVTIPANGLKDATTGTAFTGNATIETFYLTPSNVNFAELMPGGDLAAIDSSSNSVILLSYGMMDVKLTDGSGNKLQIADGSTATVKFPIEASMQAGAPTTMPLWTFDVTKGVWVEEGVATKSLDGTYYEGTVTHFSWVNLDYPQSRATVKGTVTDGEGAPVQGIKVVIEQVCRYTDQDGKYSAYVPANTPVTVSIKASDYFGNTITSKNVLAMTGGEETICNFTLPTMPKVSGTVTSCTTTTGEEAIITVSYYDNGTFEQKTSCGKTTNGTFSIPIGNNVTYVTINAYRGGNLGEKSTSITAGTNFDAGQIQVCTQIQTGANSMTLNGSTYSNISINFDGVNGASMQQEGGMFSWYSINLVSEAIITANNPMYSASIQLNNITATGTYTYPPADYNGPYFDLNLNVEGTYIYANSGTLTLSSIGPVGSLINGSFTGIVGDPLAPINATINFSVIRNPNVIYNF